MYVFIYSINHINYINRNLHPNTSPPPPSYCLPRPRTPPPVLYGTYVIHTLWLVTLPKLMDIR